MVKINRCGTKLNKESDRSIFEPLRRAIGQYSTSAESDWLIFEPLRSLIRILTEDGFKKKYKRKLLRTICAHNAIDSHLHSYLKGTLLATAVTNVKSA